MLRSSAPARRYAEAAFGAATDEDAVDRWRDELARIVQAYVDPRVGAVLRDPSRQADARLAMLRRVLAEPPLLRTVLNLVGLLLQRQRIELLPQVASEFQRLVDRRDGITPALVTSAAPLTADEVGALTERLAEITRGPVRTTMQLDPELIGGVTVQLGDRLYDGSVRGRLDRLRGRLLSGAL